MARKYIPGWQRARREAIERAGGLCAKCGIDIVAAGQRPEVNHILALIDGGHETDQSNLECLCKNCHKPHTKEVIQRNAKAKRIAKKHRGEEKRWKRQWPYRPVNRANRNRPVEERGKMR